jgi:hypothetical protein
MPREYSEEILSDNLSLCCTEGPITLHPEQVWLEPVVEDDPSGRGCGSFALWLSEGSRWLLREVSS